MFSLTLEDSDETAIFSPILPSDTSLSPALPSDTGNQRQSSTVAAIKQPIEALRI